MMTTTDEINPERVEAARRWLAEHRRATRAWVRQAEQHAHEAAGLVPGSPERLDALLSGLLATQIAIVRRDEWRA